MTGATPIRFVTAASLFDGHDAAINIVRRVLQAHGCEVIHLGHDRSVRQVVRAALCEDAHAVAVSSYQGGHVEYFSYLRESLDAAGATDVRAYGGGGGVIVPAEIALLRERGVRVFSPEDGQTLGLDGMIAQIVAECAARPASPPPDLATALAGDDRALGRVISALEAGAAPAEWADALAERAGARTPVLGITGTGGSGKSSLTDEFLRRLRIDEGDRVRVAVLAVDPTRRRGGGALLGDRIRVNSVEQPSVFFRSLATRGAASEIPEHLAAIITLCRATHDLVVVETPGIGQGDAGIVPFVDVSTYVMTPEFGAASQLEKIDMLDFADVVAINKFDRRGAQDARRDVARQLLRNRGDFTGSWEQMPVFGTSAARFDDDGVTAFYQAVRDRLIAHGLRVGPGTLTRVETHEPTGLTSVVPPARSGHLADVAAAVRAYHAATADQERAARLAEQVTVTATHLAQRGADTSAVAALLADAKAAVDPSTRTLLESWPALRALYAADDLALRVRDRVVRSPLVRTTQSGTPVPRVCLPRTDEAGAVVRFLREENVPGSFPFTAGVFALKRDAEAPTRMFAGEGDAFRTNRRFHLLAAGQPATRLSTAFDSVTLYGRDPDEQPDVYGKVGTSGVSIATLDDMKELFAGFDLCDPSTSVSMTINGPAPTILAMFLVTAIDQRLAAFATENGRPPSPADAARIREWVLANVRGTVQADILKEDQGQNTCIFSTEFSLRCMGDVQQFFVDNGVRNFYSVSISGYHIAEAGANPISQLAFTLANAFTYVEAYLARGMHVDQFAPNFSFFFSNGMDAEYTVLGRVARRIWSIAMRDHYGADERSQKLKYHVQTSGRSLHAQEMSFNDIRTTLQALCAIYDNCNSLHTNAYDEAVTTPSEQSVRRALAIQLIIDREWGLAGNENPLQGAHIVDELTDLVEQAVLAEFDRIAERGGVLGAMETGYQRGRIQDQSMQYERRKHDGSLPIVGVNTFRDADDRDSDGPALSLSRATEAEKRSQVARLARFHDEHRERSGPALARLARVAAAGGNTFAELMETVRVCSLGQITATFFEVGGQYRRGI